MEQARHIEDEVARTQFLTQVSANREILAECHREGQ